MAELGDFAEDRVTGFVGVVTGVADYIAGCRNLLLTPGVDEEGCVREGHWFDVERINVLKPGFCVVEARPTGGPTSFDPAPPAR